MVQPALEVRGLTKRFGDRTVLSGVGLTVDHGEIRGLLGANGAGKSTLIGCLSGANEPDEGTMTVNGHEHTSFTPRSAFAEGVAVIYQHFSLIPDLTVAENIHLGNEETRWGRVRRRAQEESSRDLLLSIGATIDPRIEVKHLNAGERQLVEIAKVLRRKPDVLILDEPTAALSDHEARALGDRLIGLRDAQDIGIVYVSHLLNEVFTIADTITVLRDGTVALDERISSVEPDDVISAISPTYVVPEARAVSRRSDTDHLGLKDVEVSFVGPLTFDVRRGESVALFGLLGSGRTETLETIMGVRQPHAGAMTLDGAPHRPRHPLSCVRRGIALVPADRKERGVFSDMTARENVVVPSAGKLANSGVRRFRKEAVLFKDVAQRVGLQPPTPLTIAGRFSGGNQQKLVVGRWLTEGSGVELLLLDEPTQGIDIGARQDLYGLLRTLSVEQGLTTVFASSDPEEVMQLADRVLIFHRGEIVLDASVDDLTVASLLSAAHGGSAESAPTTQGISTP